jgi:hypothetical protein
VGDLIVGELSEQRVGVPMQRELLASPRNHPHAPGDAVPEHLGAHGGVRYSSPSDHRRTAPRGDAPRRYGGAFGDSRRLDLATRAVVTSRSKVLATRLSARRVLFAFPKVDGAMVVDVKGLVESGQFTPVRRRQARTLDNIVETYRVETQQKVGNVVITLPATC